MAEFSYDIVVYQVRNDANDDEQVYRFTGPHSIASPAGSDPLFDLQVEHLEPLPSDPQRVRLKLVVTPK